LPSVQSKTACQQTIAIGDMYWLVDCYLMG